MINKWDIAVTSSLYTPVLGGYEHLRRALIGRVVRFGILRDMTAVRGLLSIGEVLFIATRKCVVENMRGKQTEF